MQTLLYIIWYALPVFFFGIALWSGLERVSNRKQQKEGSRDFVNQGFFVLVCVLISTVIDQYWLEKIAGLIAPDWIPLLFFQIVLLPVVLYLGAVLVGPSREIRITHKRKGNPRRSNSK